MVLAEEEVLNDDEAEQAELEELARGAVQCRRSLSASCVEER